MCWERHILPSVEQTLAQLQGAKVFTKLDAKLMPPHMGWGQSIHKSKQIINGNQSQYASRSLTPTEQKYAQI